MSVRGSAELDAAPRSSARAVLLAFIGLQLAQIMGTLDGTIVATALPSITDDLGGFSRVTWVVTAYALAGVATMPLHGKLGDIFGRKRMLIIALTIFLVASLACGAARTMDQLLIARFVQGVGGGGLAALPMAALADIVPARKLGRWLSYQGIMFAVSSIAGPLVGGLFVDHLSWRWAFFVNLPVGVVALVIIAVRLHAPARVVSHRLDWVGSALMVVGLSALVVVATLGGSELAWTSLTIVTLVLALPVVLVAFVWREMVAPEPALPLGLLRDSVVRIAVGVNFTSGVLIWCGIFFIPLFVQEVGGVSPTAAGLTLMPLMLGAAVGTLVSGRQVERSGAYRLWPLAGSLLMTAGVALLATVGTRTSGPVMGLYALVLGVGIGFVMQPSLLAAQNSAPVENLGTATSTTLLFRSLGATMGVPVFGGLLNSALSGSDADPAAFAQALQRVFLAGVPVGLVSIVLALRLRDKPLRERPALEVL